MLKKGEVKLKDVGFTVERSEETKDEKYTIGGKMKVENCTEKEIDFKIEAGQMFGCQDFRSSQHTVVKGMSGHLAAR